MGLIRRVWTPREAEEWTKEDTITIILSPLVYVLYTLGIALSLLLMTEGFIMLGAGIVLTFLMVYIINPKLSVVSTEYEKKQQAYLDELEKQVQWED